MGLVGNGYNLVLRIISLLFTKILKLHLNEINITYIYSNNSVRM